MDCESVVESIEEIFKCAEHWVPQSPPFTIMVVRVQLHANYAATQLGPLYTSGYFVESKSS